MAAPANTLADALDICGVNRDFSNMIFNGSTAAERVADEVFDNTYRNMMDITFAELDDTWRTYGQLTLAEGRIRLRPDTKSNIRALVQWTRDCFRTGIDPTSTPFPVVNKSNLLDRYNTHKQWCDDASNMIKSALPKQFKEDTKWLDWRTSFEGFLRTQPGRNGIPLNYIIRDNEFPIYNANPSFLDDYVDQAELAGSSFQIDATKVHTFLMRFISDNPVAEQKVLPYKDQANGRVDFIALRDYYEGVGANSRAILAAEQDISDLFYLGEKKPHMWWDEFEVRLINAFAIVDKNAGRRVHTDDMKLRLLNMKIKADFLSSMKTNIQMEMNKQPRTMNFASALANYRNTVNEKFPQDPTAHTRKRRIQAMKSGSNTTRNGGRGNRSGGRGNNAGRGHGGRSAGGGRGNQRNQNQKKDDEWKVIISWGRL